MFLFSLPFPLRKNAETGKHGYIWSSISNTSVFWELTTRFVSCGTVTACNISNIFTSSWLWVSVEFGISCITSFSAKHSVSSAFSAKHSVSSALVRISERESPSGKYSWLKLHHTLGSSTWTFPWSSLPLHVFRLMFAYTPKKTI